MLYPLNIKIEENAKGKEIKNKIKEVKRILAKTIKYLIFDTRKFCEILAIKLHI